MREVLRRPGVALLFAGDVASMFGDSIMLLALAIWVKTLTGSSGAAGAVMLTITAPALVGPLFGWLIDRFRRRRFLIVINVLTGLALLPLLAVHTRADVWIVYVVGTVYGISFTLTGGAFAGLLQELLPEELLGEANALFATAQQGLRLIGPLIGAGLFVTVGGSTIAVIDAASFGVAAIALAGVRLVEKHPQREDLHWWAEMTAGTRFTWCNRTLRRITVTLSVLMLMLGAIETLIFAYVGVGLHRTPAFISVLVTVQSIGGLAGAVFCGKIIKRLGEVTTIVLGLVAVAACVALMIYPSVALGFIGMVMAGVGASFVTVGYMTVLQRRTPNALIGRVSSAGGVLIGGAQALSITMGVILVSIVDYRILFAAMSIVALGLAVYLRSGSGAEEVPAANTDLTDTDRTDSTGVAEPVAEGMPEGATA